MSKDLSSAEGDEKQQDTDEEDDKKYAVLSSFNCVPVLFSAIIKFVDYIYKVQLKIFQLQLLSNTWIFLHQILYEYLAS